MWYGYVFMETSPDEGNSDTFSSDFWTQVDWALFAHLREYCTPLKPVTLFFNTLYMKKSVLYISLKQNPACIIREN
jgi:hypothetical protein